MVPVLSESGTVPGVWVGGDDTGAFVRPDRFGSVMDHFSDPRRM